MEVFVGFLAVVTVGVVAGLAGLFVCRKLAGKLGFCRLGKNSVCLRV